jgi:hypothetical protein
MIPGSYISVMIVVEKHNYDNDRDRGQQKGEKLEAPAA